MAGRYDRVNGVFNKVNKRYDKVNGIWQPVQKRFVKSGGIWSESFSAYDAQVHNYYQDVNSPWMRADGSMHAGWGCPNDYNFHVVQHFHFAVPLTYNNGVEILRINYFKASMSHNSSYDIFFRLCTDEGLNNVILESSTGFGNRDNDPRVYYTNSWWTASASGSTSDIYVGWKCNYDYFDYFDAPNAGSFYFFGKQLKKIQLI